MSARDPSPLKDRGAASARGHEAPGAAGRTGGPRLLEALIAELEQLPGVGRKTAERLAYHILRSPQDEALRLATAIRDVKKSLRNCRRCFHVTERDECAVCEDATRDASTICVVEQPKDVYAIESSGSYRGLYHVLLGNVSPLEGVEPRDLTVDALLERVRGGGVAEVILATNPNFEGDGTALFLREKLRAIPGVRVTRLARGIPSGSHIEHVSRTIVSDAVEGRREMPDA